MYIQDIEDEHQEGRAAQQVREKDVETLKLEIVIKPITSQVGESIDGTSKSFWFRGKHCEKKIPQNNKTIKMWKKFLSLDETQIYLFWLVR